MPCEAVKRIAGGLPGAVDRADWPWLHRRRDQFVPVVHFGIGADRPLEQAAIAMPLASGSTRRVALRLVAASPGWRVLQYAISRPFGTVPAVS